MYAKQSLGQTNYTINVDLFNVNSQGGQQYGHLGVFYNAKDINNFDFVYLRYVILSSSRSRFPVTAIAGEFGPVHSKKKSTSEHLFWCFRLSGPQDSYDGPSKYYLVLPGTE